MICIDCHGSPVDGETRNDPTTPEADLRQIDGESLNGGSGFVLRQAQDERAKVESRNGGSGFVLRPACQSYGITAGRQAQDEREKAETRNDPPSLKLRWTFGPPKADFQLVEVSAGVKRDYPDYSYLYLD